MSTPPSTAALDQLLDVARVTEAHLAELLEIARRTEAREVHGRLVAALATCEAPRDVAALWHETAPWVKPLASPRRRALWTRAVARTEALGQADAETWLTREVKELGRTPLSRLTDELAASATAETCIAVWRANRTVVASMGKDDRKTAFAALVARVEVVGKMKNAEAWVRKQLERADAQAAKGAP